MNHILSIPDESSFPDEWSLGESMEFAALDAAFPLD
jgi:hypothetical protein